MRFIKALGYALGLIWSMPHTIVGLLLCIVYRPRKVRWSDGCLEFVSPRIWGVERGAQTHGLVVFYSEDLLRYNEPLRVHERVHVLQGFIGGPFYPLLYVLHFAFNFAVGIGPNIPTPRWHRAYAAICFEQQARRITNEWYDGKRPGQWGEL